MRCEMQYGELKAKLARVHNVQPEDMGAFTGRLRVLRDLGIPKVTAAGSGRRIEFDNDQYAEVHLALLLDEIGISPMFVAKVIQEYRRLLWPKDRYLMIRVHANCGRAQNPHIFVSIVSTYNRDFGSDVQIIVDQSGNGHHG